jgi:hypothetical protein
MQFVLIHNCFQWQDSSSAVTIKKEKENKGGSDSNKTDKVDKPPSERASSKKKSSWYNVLYPTYKTRSEGFKRIFRDLPLDERLVVGKPLYNKF